MDKIVLLLLLAACVYLVGNARTQLFDRDEPRYAQCSRQMLQSGDWAVPRLYDKIRAAKPPGIYWCQATMMKALGDNAFAARMPSVLAGLFTAALLAFVLWRPLGRQRTFWTLFVFTTSALTIISAKVCLTDSVLLLWTTISLICMYLLWQGRGGWAAVVILAVSIGIGGLIKGPFILGVLGGTVVVLGALRLLERMQLAHEPLANSSIWREPRPPTYQAASSRGTSVLTHASPVRPSGVALKVIVKVLVGIAIVLAIVLPWVWLVQHRAPGFLLASTKDAMEHLEKGSEGHKGPPGYHLAMIWVTFLPWSLLLPMAIAMGFRNRRMPEIRFALAAALGTWIFVEVLQTKLPHYMLPAFPALAMLTGDAIVHCLNGEARDLQSRAMRIAAVGWGLAILVIATVPWWWIAARFRQFDWLSLITLSALAALYVGVVLWLLWSCRSRPALLVMGAGSIAFAAVLFGLYFPRCRPLRLSSEVARVLRAHDVVHGGQVLMLDYKEPSLGFYQGGTIREAKHSLPVIEHVDSAPPWMVVSRRIWDEAPAASRSRLQMIADFKGLNYSEALEPTEVLVVRKK